MKLIIDVKNTLYRVGWKQRTRTCNNGQTLIGPLFGFIDFLRAALFRFPNTTEIVLAADPVMQRARSWRADVYPDYKKSDEKTGDAAVLIAAVESNMRLLRDLAAGLPVTWVEDANWEADDLMADMAARVEPHQQVTILSQDKDLLQLCGYPNVTVAHPYNGNYLLFMLSNFASAFDILHTKNDKKPVVSGLTPRAFVVYKCLMGDRSDNIPGLMGIAEVRALHIVQTAAQECGGMEFLSPDPAVVFQCWTRLLRTMPDGGPKWARTALIENPQAIDVLMRNYKLISLLRQQHVTYTDSFRGTYQRDWIRSWFAHYGFHEYVSGESSAAIDSVLERVPRNAS